MAPRVGCSHAEALVSLSVGVRKKAAFEVYFAAVNGQVYSTVVDLAEFEQSKARVQMNSVLIHPYNHKVYTSIEKFPNLNSISAGR